jgi:hypothetical protein
MTNDFSLVLGGPLYQLFLRSRLARPPLNLLHRRLIFFPLITWAVPFILSLQEGMAAVGARVTFTHDVLTHTRFLVALPLFLIAEVVVHARIRPIIDEFAKRRLIAPAEQPKFQQMIQSAMRWRNSVPMELILFAFCFTGGHLLWQNFTSLKASTWYASYAPGQTQLTRAGWWYAWVSMPVFHFIVLRWYYRMFVWARFLWQVSRLPLRLVVTHPDRAGGLGFLAFTSEAFMPIVVAQGALAAGLIGGRIFFEGASLSSFKIQLLAIVVFQLLIVLGPLCVFSLPLLEARRAGLRAYGAIAMQYVDAFDRKWNRGTSAASEEILGSADVQSLADMGNSYNLAEHMLLFPFGKDAVLRVTLMTLFPMVPFVLSIMPMETLIRQVAKILF